MFLRCLRVESVRSLVRHLRDRVVVPKCQPTAFFIWAGESSGSKSSLNDCCQIDAPVPDVLCS